MEINHKSYVNRIKDLEKQAEELETLKREQFSQQNEAQRMRTEVEHLTNDLREFEKIKHESAAERFENERLKTELQHLQKQLQLIEDQQKITSQSSDPFNAELKSELEKIRNQMKDLANENQERRMEIYTNEMKGELAMLKDQIKDLDITSRRKSISNSSNHVDVAAEAQKDYVDASNDASHKNAGYDGFDDQGAENSSMGTNVNAEGGNLSLIHI